MALPEGLDISGDVKRGYVSIKRCSAQAPSRTRHVPRGVKEQFLEARIWNKWATIKDDNSGERENQ